MRAVEVVALRRAVHPAAMRVERGDRRRPDPSRRAARPSSGAVVAARRPCRCSASMSSANAVDPLGVALAGRAGRPAGAGRRRDVCSADPVDDVRVRADRDGRRSASRDVGRRAGRRSAVASRSQASAARTAVRSSELGADAAVRPAIPAAPSATCTGASSDVDPGEHGDRRPATRPSASAARDASTVASSGSSVGRLDQPPARRCAPARIVLGTRRRLWRSRRSAASTTPAGQR